MEETSYDSIIVVDNAPKVGADRMGKLKSVLNKVFGRFGQIVSQEYPVDEEGVFKGCVLASLSLSVSISLTYTLFSPFPPHSPPPLSLCPLSLTLPPFLPPCTVYSECDISLLLYKCRYFFIEFATPEQAANAVKTGNGYRLDKSHVFAVNFFSDFEK